jgi:hypothetical protein
LRDLKNVSMKSAQGLVLQPAAVNAKRSRIVRFMNPRPHRPLPPVADEQSPGEL